MNKSYTIVAAKGLTEKEVSEALNLSCSSGTSKLGVITQGDESIDSVFAVGAKGGITLALTPGLIEESQEFYSLIGEGREVGLFISDFETASATVSIFEGFNPKTKWKVSGGELLEDLNGRFGDPNSGSEDECYFHDLDLEPWNDLYQFMGTSPDDVSMSLFKRL